MKIKFGDEVTNGSNLWFWSIILGNDDTSSIVSLSKIPVRKKEKLKKKTSGK